MKIYLAHQISGLTRDQVVGYYDDLKYNLLKMGYTPYSPMAGKEQIRTDNEYKPHGYDDYPMATDHAIFERDQWMIKQCDIVLVDLENTTDKVSIGCTMEIAWGAILGKHTILVMGDGNPHEHAFYLEAADIRFKTIGDALSYLYDLATDRITGGVTFDVPETPPVLPPPDPDLVW